MIDKEICAVVVTYNRKELLIRCINQILLQTRVPDILIFDNYSSDGTKDYLIQKKILQKSNVRYFKADRNMGGAGGFSVGTQMAFEAGYQYIWLMDDDGYPYNADTLHNLYEMALKENTKKIMLNSLVICNNQKDLCFTLKGKNKYTDILLLEKDGVIEGDINPFNGTFITNEVVNIIGVPNAEFFIYGDEKEYFMRAKLNKIKIMTVLDSLFFHSNVPVKVIHILWKKKYYREDKIWQIYYEKRNQTYITKLYSDNWHVFVYIMRSFFDFLCYKKDRIRKIKIHFKGIKDGLKGDFSIIGIWE